MTDGPQYPTIPAYPAAAPPPPPEDPVVPPEPPRKGPSWWGVIGVAAIVALVIGTVVGLIAGLIGYAIGRSVDPRGSSGSSISLPQAPGDTSPRSDDSIAGIAEAVLPSVVSIVFEGSGQAGGGSGFVLSSDGYILTNNHVVEAVADGGELQAIFNDGEEANATIVGRNPSYDLAVIKVDRTGLTPVALGDSNAVRVGDTAIAIGAPLGLDGTVTSGIVSALDRPVTAGGTGELAYIDAIQTDAAINPGNSGGPLLDGAGQVIGVNSAIATLAFGGDGGNIGLGFAIPINSAKRIAEEIITDGESETPIIGVILNLAYSGVGAEISEVSPGGPSAEAGLEPGDVITKVNDRSIQDSTELVVAIRSYAPGDTVSVTVDRDGRAETYQVTLAAGE